jgi:hypothetical protein
VTPRYEAVVASRRAGGWNPASTSGRRRLDRAPAKPTRRTTRSSVQYSSMRNVHFLLICVALALGTHPSSAQRTYRRAEIDSTGQLRIALSNQRVIRPARDSGQVAFDQVALSSDHRVVGWVALFPNCCTSYPIPLELVLLRADGGRTVISNELPIWQWTFAADGRNVVIRQAPVHGSAPMHFELRHIRTGTLIATAQADSATQAALPRWARAAMPMHVPSPPPSHER